METAVSCKIKVNNMPVMRDRHGFMVVRRDERSAELWYYGTYSSESTATEIAVEIGNGFVVEI